MPGAASSSTDAFVDVQWQKSKAKKGSGGNGVSFEVGDPSHDSEFKALTQRRLYDNFKDFSPEEKHDIVDSGGRTLEQRIEERLRLNAVDPSKNPMGPQWYQEMRKRFRGPDNPMTRLANTVTEEGETVPAGIARAGDIYTSTRRRAAFDEQMALLKECNLLTFVGVCRYAITLHPASGDDALKYSKNLLKFLKKHRCFERWPDTAFFMKPVVDATMMEIHRKSSRADQKPNKFATKHAVALGHLAAAADWEACAKCTAFAEVHENLMRICQTRIGFKLFAMGLKGVAQEAVQKTMHEKIISWTDEMLSAQQVITEDAWHDVRSDILAGIQENAELVGSLPPKRTIDVPYLGQKCGVEVKSLLEEVDIRWSAHWKQLAVRSGALTAIGPELELAELGVVAPEWAQMFDPELLGGAEDARENANAVLAALPSQDGASVKAALQKHKSQFIEADAGFDLELCYFAALVGQPGVERLQAKFLATMASEAKHVAIASARGAQRKLMATPLFKFVPEGARKVVRMAADGCQAVAEGNRPAFGSQGGAFLRLVSLRLEYFARWTPADGEPLWGKKAVTTCLANAENLDAKDVVEDDLDFLVLWEWILEADEKARLTALKAAWETQAQETAKTAGKPPPKKRKTGPRANVKVEVTAPEPKKLAEAGLELAAGLSLFKTKVAPKKAAAKGSAKALAA